jgi:hypothetical protein
MDEDFILVHKSLFEYLYGVYGCDYFILAKQKNLKIDINTRENSTASRTDAARSDTMASKEKTTMGSKMILAGGSAASKPNAGLSTQATQMNYKEYKNNDINSQNSSLTGTSWQNPVSGSRQASSIYDNNSASKPK